MTYFFKYPHQDSLSLLNIIAENIELVYKEKYKGNLINDISKINIGKGGCKILKFSNGGHLLAAAKGRIVYILRAFTRDTIRSYRFERDEIVKLMFSDFFED